MDFLVKIEDRSARRRLSGGYLAARMRINSWFRDGDRSVRYWFRWLLYEGDRSPHDKVLSIGIDRSKPEQSVWFHMPANTGESIVFASICTKSWMPFRIWTNELAPTLSCRTCRHAIGLPCCVSEDAMRNGSIVHEKPLYGVSIYRRFKYNARYNGVFLDRSCYVWRFILYFV